MSEPRYTLHEAQTELRRRECAMSGHSWDVIESLRGGPVRIVCRCGASHPVGRDERDGGSTRADKIAERVDPEHPIDLDWLTRGSDR